MTPQELQAFAAVAEHGSFSRAADELHLTQSAVSKRIAALEDELDSRLFDRIGHRIRLTEAGTALLPRAHDLLLRIADTRRAVADLSGRVRGRLRVGTSHHIGLHRLPAALRAYTQDYPDVELDLEFMGSEAACQAVAHGDLELGIVTLPTQAPPTLAVQPIWQDPLIIVIGRDHPLARKKRVAAADLAAVNAILPAEGTFTRELIEQGLAPVGIQPKVVMSTNYLETIKMLVSVGLGWSVLPQTLRETGLKVIRLAGVSISRQLGVVHHRERTLSNAARALIGLLEQSGSGSTQKPK